MQQFKTMHHHGISKAQITQFFRLLRAFRQFRHCHRLEIIFQLRKRIAVFGSLRGGIVSKALHPPIVGECQRGAKAPARETSSMAVRVLAAAWVAPRIPRMTGPPSYQRREGGAAGCCLVKEAVCPSAQVIAVQAERAPAAYLSWKQKKIVKDRVETAAEGLATQVGYELTQEILWDYLSDFILVSEDEMKQAILTYLELVRNLAEEAGASPLAAALKIKERLKGKKIALILSGGNISLERLKTVLSLKTN